MKIIKMMMAAALGVLVSCSSVKSGEEVVAASRDSKVVVAYVTSWSDVMPDPQYMTHINYAFGHVNERFNGVLPSVDFVNIMAYDMATAPKHHSALYPSEHSGDITSDGAVTAHLKAGVPPSKLVMGMPFYGRGGDSYPSFQDYNKVGNTDTQYTEKWDEVAQVPYLADKNDTLVFGFENPRSLAIKCQYILDKDLLGGMYWDYSGDNEQGDLRRTVAENLLGKPHKTKVLVLTERGGQHGGFTDAGLKWLASEGAKGNFSITEINNAKHITEAYLSQFSLVIQLDFPPYTWPKEAEDAFVKYIEEGRGGWIGFHHATLLGEFDGYPMWQWFSDFMGGVRFKNYIAPLADGTLIVEDKQHPVMKDVPASFVVPDDEWYTYDKSPRPNVHVLANVDESSYTPASDIKMGDHPVVWVNKSKKARNVYFQIGHSSKLYETEGFTTMFRNAINWTLES